MTPIEVPINPAYGPVTSTYSIQAKIQALGSRKKTLFSMSGIYGVTRTGERLRWEFAIHHIKQGDQYIRADSPLVVARCLSDPQGKIMNMDMDFPAFEKAGTITKQQKKQLSAAFNNIQNFSPHLSPKPIKTGDIFTKSPLNQLFFGESPLFKREELAGKSLTSTLVGWGEYLGRKVGVTETNRTFQFEKSTIRVRGYGLFDPETFHCIENNMLMEIHYRGDTVLCSTFIAAQLN
ncbi:MAG: hypothetical protein R6V46_18885 [Desulfatiglandaceae bacterium]